MGCIPQHQYYLVFKHFNKYMYSTLMGTILSNKQFIEICKVLSILLKLVLSALWLNVYKSINGNPARVKTKKLGQLIQWTN